MAEVFVKPPTTKKRKVEGKNMKLMKQLSMMEGADSLRTSAAGGAEIQPTSVQSGLSQFKRTYHLGGKKYAVFYGPNGIIEEIHIKEWDGKKVNSSITLNVPKFVTYLHNTEYLSQSLKKIVDGQGEIEVKVHIGELVHLTCNSPYKVIQFRRWKKNRDEEIYPTKDGISLKPKEWEEFVKYSNQIYGERLEIFKCTPCLIDPNQPNHDSLTCAECSVLHQESRGLVEIDIPL